LYPAAALSEALEGTDIGLEAVKDAIDRNTFHSNVNTLLQPASIPHLKEMRRPAAAAGL